MQVIMGSQNMNCHCQILFVLTFKCLQNRTQYLPKQLADMVVEMCNSAEIVEEIVDAVATEAFNNKQEEEVVNQMNNTQMIKNVYRRNSFIHYEWGPEKVFKFVAEQMVMEMVDDKEQEMVNNVALFRIFQVRAR